MGFTCNSKQVCARVCYLLIILFFSVTAKTFLLLLIYDSCFKCSFWQFNCQSWPVLSMAKQKAVPEEILERVKANFAAKRDVIVSHSKPWTPWALAQLLEIDDTHTTQPAEIIMYTALKASAPNRIGIADSVTKVNCMFLYNLFYMNNHNILFDCFLLFRARLWPGLFVHACGSPAVPFAPALLSCFLMSLTLITSAINLIDDIIIIPYVLLVVHRYLKTQICIFYESDIECLITTM